MSNRFVVITVKCVTRVINSEDACELQFRSPGRAPLVQESRLFRCKLWCFRAFRSASFEFEFAKTGAVGNTGRPRPTSVDYKITTLLWTRLEKQISYMMSIHLKMIYMMMTPWIITHWSTERNVCWQCGLNRSCDCWVTRARLFSCQHSTGSR